MTSNALGLFGDPDSALEAAGRLMTEGFERPEIMSPIPIHGVDDVLGPKKSVIKRFTLFGDTGNIVTISLVNKLLILPAPVHDGRIFIQLIVKNTLEIVSWACIVSS